MNNCKVCGFPCDKEYCFKHKPKIKLKQCRIKPTLSTKKQVNDGYIPQMKVFFNGIWNKRPHKSEISNEYLGKEASSAFFHHILPKSKYPEAEYDEENIILLTMDEHNNVENDIYKYEEINRRREILKRKYNIS